MVSAARQNNSAIRGDLWSEQWVQTRCFGCENNRSINTLPPQNKRKIALQDAGFDLNINKPKIYKCKTKFGIVNMMFTKQVDSFVKM